MNETDQTDEVVDEAPQPEPVDPNTPATLGQLQRVIDYYNQTIKQMAGEIDTALKALNERIVAAEGSSPVDRVVKAAMDAKVQFEAQVKANEAVKQTLASVLQGQMKPVADAEDADADADAESEDAEG